MSELTDRERDTIADTSVSSHEASQFVSQCDCVDESELKTFLSQNIAKTDMYLKLHGKESAETYIRIVAKGLRKKSKKSNALRFFYYGYHIRQQEELLEKHRTEMLASARTILISKKHYGDILRFLYERGCSQQKSISEELGVNKSNLSRIMNSLLDNDLVVKSVGPRCVFFELSASGYKFVREHSLLSKDAIKAKQLKSPLQSFAEEIKLDIRRSWYFYDPSQTYEIAARWISSKRKVEDQNDLMAVVQRPLGEKEHDEPMVMGNAMVDWKVVHMLKDAFKEKQAKNRNKSRIFDAKSIVRSEY